DLRTHERLATFLRIGEPRRRAVSLDQAQPLVKRGATDAGAALDDLRQRGRRHGTAGDDQRLLTRPTLEPALEPRPARVAARPRIGALGSDQRTLRVQARIEVRCRPGVGPRVETMELDTSGREDRK